jgi:allantoin racemase
LVADGCDVLIPGGGIPMLLFLAIRQHVVDGAPVINGIPIVVKMAELAVKLRRLTGLGVSRVSDYVQPPAEVIAEFMAHPKGLVNAGRDYRALPEEAAAAEMLRPRAWMGR